MTSRARWPWCLGVACALLVAGCAAPAEAEPCVVGTFDATMAEVIDGDTVALVECDLRLRLALVDTPERGEAGFEEATAFTEELCPVDGPVVVDLDAGQPLDTTGTRLVGVLWCDGVNLNAELVAEGFAVIDVRFCDRSEFADDDWAYGACAG